MSPLRALFADAAERLSRYHSEATEELDAWLSSPCSPDDPRTVEQVLARDLTLYNDERVINEPTGVLLSDVARCVVGRQAANLEIEVRRSAAAREGVASPLLRGLPRP